MSQNCASQISNYTNEIQENIKTTVQDVATSSLLKDSSATLQSAMEKVDRLTNPQAYASRERQAAQNAWETKHYGRSRETFDNVVEGFDSEYPIYKGIKEDIEARHNVFKSDSNFNVKCDANIDKTMKDIKDKEGDDFKRLQNHMSAYLSSYKSLFNYKASMSALLSGKMNKLNEIKNKVDTYKQNLFMDNRKDNYQQKNYDFYKSIHFFVMIIYFSIFVLYLIFSDFIKDEQYKNIFMILLMILYLAMPFMLKYILHYIYSTYIYILEYNNLKEEVISYPYIVGE